MTAPAKAAPMREDVTQAVVEKIETVTGDYFQEEGEPFYRVVVDGHCADFDHEQAANNFAAAINRLAHTARPDDGDEDVERVALERIADLSERWEDSLVSQINEIAREGLAGSKPICAPSTFEAVQWALDEIEGRTFYPGSELATPEQQRQNCIDKLTAALAAMREGADRGMVEVTEANVDWRRLATLAGDYGIRYRTNAALIQFLNAALSPEQPR